jgi:hypothetical protein
MELFHRENQNVQISGFSKCEKIQIEEDVLFLSTCHRFIDDVSFVLLNYFRNIRVVDVWDEDLSNCEYLCDPDICAKLLPLIKSTDNGIQHLKHTTKYTFPEIIYNIPKKNDQRIFIEEFSPGVKRVIGLAYQMLQAIEKNQIVIIDEIDIQLHPRLFGALLDFYHNHQSSQSQLIFTTHNTYPLWKKMLRRDQIWFVNKNNDLSSELVNFTEFKIPPEASYENDYLNGRYGGVPLLEM